MTGSLRYVLALAFVALYLLIPEVDHRYVAYLETRSWLVGEDSPLAKAVGEGAESVPVLQVQILGGTSEDLQRETADYARAGREWARGQDLPIDESRSLVLEVRHGDNGFRSTLFRDGTAVEALEIQREPIADPPPGEKPPYYPDNESLVPAFLAIVLAILTGKVIPSLLIGCLAGCIWLWGGLWDGTRHLFGDVVFTRVLQDQFQLEILGFVVFLFSAVGVMTRSGGIQGMVDWIRGYARGPLSTQVCTFAIGLLIFFDDYTNCILTGTTMRPLADKNGVSREKLSYLVDATAAPIAGVALFSTWIAYEVSTFSSQLPEVTRTDGTPYTRSEGFEVFLQTLPFRFYCLFTLVFVAIGIFSRREFGGMLRAERRALHEGKPIADDASPMQSRGMIQLEPAADIPRRGRNALIPLGLLVSLTIGLIFWFGLGATAPEERTGAWWQVGARILGNGESQRALMFASIVALVVAGLLAISQRLLTVRQTVSAAVRSTNSLLFAIIILILAWSIGKVCEDLNTAKFLTAAFHGSFAGWLLPIVMFLISSLVAFSTGTSYGTMAILLPNVVVLSHTMGETLPELGGPALMVLTIGAVLEGSIFGDHCSPISDTTVLSSVATGSDHLHHVRTQAPYAITVMLISMVCGYIPAALFGLGVWPIAWALGIGAMVLVFLVFGRRPGARTPPVAPG